MALSIPNLRINVLSTELKSKLHEYLLFRHLFRNIYDPQLKWDYLIALAQDVESLFSQTSAEIENFLQFLSSL
jgi:hypothetical protein